MFLEITLQAIKMIMEKNYLKNDMMFILKSEIRLKILTELKDKPQTIRQIVDNTKMAYSSVSNNLNKLEYKNHVEKENRVYTITPMTKIYFNQLNHIPKIVNIFHLVSEQKQKNLKVQCLILLNQSLIQMN